MEITVAKIISKFSSKTSKIGSAVPAKSLSELYTSRLTFDYYIDILQYILILFLETHAMNTPNIYLVEEAVDVRNVQSCREFL